MYLSGLFVNVSVARKSSMSSFVSKISLVLTSRKVGQACVHLRSHRGNELRKAVLYSSSARFGYFSMNRVSNLCTVAISAASKIDESSLSASDNLSGKARRKAHRQSPEGLLQQKLNMCSKNGDLIEALRLYDEARRDGVLLNQNHYNSLLYLCTSGSAETMKDEIGEDVLSLGLKRGFDIFQQMVVDNVPPNEATFTNAARIAAAKEDPEMAFDLVKQMKRFGIPPKLRSYGPALFGFCNKRKADESYEVDAHMIASGVVAEEPELSALLNVSIDAKKGYKVYEMLHRLRATVRQVSESTAGMIENWFKSEDAAEVGEKNWDVNKVKDGIVNGGGGWHGQGWLGSGHWKVVRTQVHETGVCLSCGEKLVCIDIDPKETENFAASLTTLAQEREAKAGFNQFQEWIQKHGPFDAVIDGANIGLVNQRNFSFFQLKTVVNRMRQLSPSKKMPLVILHKSRVTGGPAQNPNNKKLLEDWKKCGGLYATPVGSNDDWYWLYAAVSSNCLLVTNDEMRDHLFQLLGTNFFPRWKEKHQVRMSALRSGLKLHMPPPYSVVIQESENGSWHVPTTTGDDIENPRQWLCATRASASS